MLTGYRVKKRTFLVAGLAITASLLIAGMMSLYAASLLGPGVLHRFSLIEQPQQSVLQGSGINICSVQPGNLISDGSFEPVIYGHFLTAFSGSQDTLAVSSSEASLEGLYSDDFFVGAQARIMTLDANGLRLKKQAIVRSYLLNQPGLFQPIRLPADMPSNFQIYDVSILSQDRLIAGGSKGLVLAVNDNEVQALTSTGSSNSIVDVDAKASSAVACSNAGEVYLSTDGYVWEQIYGPDINLKSISLSENGRITAVGKNGRIVSGNADGMQVISNPSISHNLNKVASWQGGWLAAGSSGVILFSADAVVWEQVPVDSNTDWIEIIADDTGATIIGTGGEIAVISTRNGNATARIISSENSPELISVAKVNRTQMIGLDDKGVFWLSQDEGASFRKSELSTGIAAVEIAYNGKGRIVAIDNKGRMAHSQLVAGISLDSPLQDGQFQAGDLVYLSKLTDGSLIGDSIKSEQGSYWITDDQDFVRRVISEDSPAGKGYLEVDIDQQTVLYQSIDRDELRSQLENNVLRFSGWFKTSDSDASASISIEGLARAVSTEFSLTPGQWRRHQYSFVVPEVWLQDQDVYLRIELHGNGRAAVDDLKLTAATNSGKEYAESSHKEIELISPEIMRMQQVPIGRLDAPAMSWLEPAGQAGYVFMRGVWQLQRAAALAPALELAFENESSPWLVIDSASTQEELASLIEYLAAPVSEQYGRIRMEQGRAVPWTESFARIYIEVADDGMLFADDRMRSSYVDWVIAQISSSPYYNEIKHRLVFVDAMTYSQGLMQSSADFHASALEAEGKIDGIKAMESLYAEYWNNIPRNTDKLAQDWPEMMRRVRFANANTSLAEMTTVMSYDLGGQTGLSLIDQGCKENGYNIGSDKQKTSSAATLLSRAAVGKPQKVIRLSASEDVFVFAAKDGESVRVVISNTGDMPATCQLVTDYDLADSVISKYDADGSLIGTEKLRRNEAHITVLPGGVVYLEKLDSR